MNKTITVNYSKEDEKIVIGVGDETYQINLVLHMLVSAIASLVQLCGEQNYKLKDYQLMHRIKYNLDNGLIIETNQDLMVILTTNLEHEWINISFPRKQGYLPIDQTIDLITQSIYNLIQKDKNPLELRSIIEDALDRSFIKPDSKPIEFTDTFLSH